LERSIGGMSTRPAPEHQPLIDPLAFEEAGRHFREWLDRLLGRSRSEGDTSIAWESGEPDDDSPPTAH
jgi:hypothetical protein